MVIGHNGVKNKALNFMSLGLSGIVGSSLVRSRSWIE